MVRLLLSYGANPQGASQDGRTPHGHDELLKNLDLDLCEPLWPSWLNVKNTIMGEPHKENA
jgi:hypothetical protein